MAHQCGSFKDVLGPNVSSETHLFICDCSCADDSWTASSEVCMPRS